MDWIGLDLTFPITDPTWIFLLVLLIILFAPILLNKLRIPHIIGMILAGLAIGEHGFNILARDSSFQLFGKVGLYYIMFLAGLEMNMGDFKETRNKALVLGLLAFIAAVMILTCTIITWIREIAMQNHCGMFLRRRAKRHWSSIGRVPAGHRPLTAPICT